MRTRPADRATARRVLAWPLLGLVAAYRYAVSPLLGTNCRFEPSCSAYARQALLRYGAVKGGWLAVRRVARCNPWGGSGYDPVPDETACGDRPGRGDR